MENPLTKPAFLDNAFFPQNNAFVISI